ncbi:MAG: TetR/AcrR family transcriptional regulator [Acidimicrobiales bacterium]
MTTDQFSHDGRSARRERNRETVVDAVLDAIEGGAAIPTIRRVAELAGVSERSIFRYFGDLDELLAAAIDAAMKRYGPCARIAHEGHGTVEDRIDALIEARLLLWVRSDAAAALVRARAATLPLLQETLTESRRKMREQSERHLADVLDQLSADERSHALHMIDLVVSYESFRLQLDAGATSDQVRARWRYALRKLLLPLGSADRPHAGVG